MLLQNLFLEHHLWILQIAALWACVSFSYLPFSKCCTYTFMCFILVGIVFVLMWNCFSPSLFLSLSLSFTLSLSGCMLHSATSTCDWNDLYKARKRRAVCTSTFESKHLIGNLSTIFIKKYFFSKMYFIWCSLDAKIRIEKKRERVLCSISKERFALHEGIFYVQEQFCGCWEKSPLKRPVVMLPTR